MKLKTLVATMALTCASSVALAQNYNFEVGVNYTDVDYDAGGNDDFFGVYGEYHFQEVRPGNNPLAEAAFINRSSNAYVIGNNDLDVVTAGVEFYIPDTIFYGAAEIKREDYDGSSTENDWGVRLGLTPITGLLVWTEYYDEPGYDANIHAKYVVPLGGGNFVNVEGGYADYDENDVFDVAADFYFDRTFSVGAGYVDYDYDDGFLLRTRKFFTPEISAELAYTKFDIADTITIGASFRF
ncbi:putative porin [Cellvibrio sp. PSBB006]|uniref:putative porin n=1 Tax=Cellvibrio sp. PSBB006 TaxID=1987723 RepID=UPI000B3B5313|nr:putative porin [Cellvibrio sp. PSBB006]ARU29497.1 hypothetical protein CBR65_19780 [Cellvibrio sp. PSBB006]